jgi:hypothetical protein
MAHRQGYMERQITLNGTVICEICGQLRPQGSWPICSDGTGKHGHTMPHGGSRITAMHHSEKSVIYRNPRTGETRYPPRNDQPIPPVYARQGYERVELDTPQAIRQYEKETGRIHERSWYDPGSATAERDMEACLNAPPIRGLDEPSV